MDCDVRHNSQLTAPKYEPTYMLPRTSLQPAHAFNLLIVTMRETFKHFCDISKGGRSVGRLRSKGRRPASVLLAEFPLRFAAGIEVPQFHLLLVEKTAADALFHDVAARIFDHL